MPQSNPEEYLHDHRYADSVMSALPGHLSTSPIKSATLQGIEVKGHFEKSAINGYAFHARWMPTKMTDARERYRERRLRRVDEDEIHGDK